MGVLWLGADWPIHDLAERYLYSMHMTQHLLFTLVAAPILIAGMPVWLLRELLAPAPIRRIFRFMTRPLVALIFFNAVLLFTHWPDVVAASVGSELVHFALHVLIVTSALVMWWPVMSPLPEMPSLPAARADALPVPAVAGSHDPRVVPDVRAHAACTRCTPRSRGSGGSTRSPIS